MRLWILSDLHLELTRSWHLPAGRPDFDVMVVAGDLVTRMERGVRWLLDRMPDKPVVYVAGNHEAYGVDVDRTVEKAMEVAEGTKVFVLQNRWIRFGDVTFAGATLWTDFELFHDQRRAMTVAADRMNDHKKIRTARYHERFLPGHALARHMESRAFLEAEMRKPRDGPLVVVTHHAPMPERASPPERQHPSSDLSDEEVLTAAYRSDLTSLMWPAPIADGQPALRPADIWIFGHTHEFVDTVIGSTRVVSNAKGHGPWLPQRSAAGARQVPPMDDTPGGRWRARHHLPRADAAGLRNRRRVLLVSDRGIGALRHPAFAIKIGNKNNLKAGSSVRRGRKKIQAQSSCILNGLRDRVVLKNEKRVDRVVPKVKTESFSKCWIVEYQRDSRVVLSWSPQ